MNFVFLLLDGGVNGNFGHLFRNLKELEDFMTKISFYMLQVDKLKVLSESLSSSCTKAEKRILEHQYGTFY